MEPKKILINIIIIILLLVIAGSVAFFGYIFFLPLFTALVNHSVSLQLIPLVIAAAYLVINVGVWFYEKATGRKTGLIWRKVDGPLPDETGNPVTAFAYCGIFACGLAFLFYIMVLHPLSANSTLLWFTPFIIVGLAGVFVAGFGLLSYLYLEQFFNPLTEEEMQDPLERTITVDMPRDRAFDLCLAWSRTLSRWPAVIPDRGTGKIFVTLPWMMVKISISISWVGTNQTRVHIRSDYLHRCSNRLYTPLQERRTCIRVLNMLQENLDATGNYP